MKFNVEEMSGIVNKATKGLKDRTLGGVTKESALDSIQKGVSEALNKGEELVGKVQQELQQFKNKTAQEMSEMTSKNDKVVFETKNAAQKAINEVKEKAAELVKKAKAIKSSSKTLSNGNTEIRKVNKNGAVMVKEVNPQGVTVRSEVTNLAGDYRKTLYDPISGKPLKTFTDVNGDKLIEYKNGILPSVKSVNNKKLKPTKPTVVSQSQPKPGKTSYLGESASEFERIYSDGSKEIITEVTRDKNVERICINGYNPEGKLVSEITSHPGAKAKYTQLYDPESNSRIKIQEFVTADGIKNTKKENIKFDDTIGGYSLTSGEHKIGENTIKFHRLKDEFGLITEKFQAKINHGKGSGKPASQIEGTYQEITKAFFESTKS